MKNVWWLLILTGVAFGQMTVSVKNVGVTVTGTLNNFASRSAGTNVVGGSGSIKKVINFDTSSDYAQATTLVANMVPSLLPRNGTSDYSLMTFEAGGPDADSTHFLRFTIPSQSAADSAGTFTFSFPPIHNGEEIYIQFRARWNSYLATHQYLDSQGFKSFILGDDTDTSTCTAGELVMNEDAPNSTSQLGFPLLYHDCGVSEILQSMTTPSGNLLDQNVYGCKRYQPSLGVTTGPYSGCWKYPADEWVTVQVHEAIGTCGLSNYSTTGEIWLAHSGQVSELITSVVDVGLGCSNTNGIGRFSLTPYATNKNATEVTSTGFYDVDDVIVSSRRLPDPDVGVPNAPDTLRASTVSSSQINLTWRDNSLDETGFKIDRCAGLAEACQEGGTWTQIASVAANTTSYSDSTGLSSGAWYSYRVKAYNGSGNSAPHSAGYMHTPTASGAGSTAKTN